MSNYTYSRQRRPAKREQSKKVNLCYLDDEERPCNLIIGWSKKERDFTRTAKDLHRYEYCEANGTIVACIQNRFYQPGYTVLHTEESLLMKVCKKVIVTRIFHLNVICNMYHSDFDNKQLRVQLQLLGTNFDVVTADGAMNMFHLK